MEADILGVCVCVWSDDLEGSLEVYWGGVALSMETAYSVLLGNTVPLHRYHAFAHLCRFGYIVRRHVSGSHLTSYERAIGIGKSRGALAKRKKLREHKLDEGVTVKHSRDAKTPKLTSTSSSACDCEMTLGDPEGRSTCLCRCRGWFSSSWPQSDAAPERSSLNADQSLLLSAETSTRCACAQLAELHLECSSAAKWKELKCSRHEDSEALLSSPAAVLWSGTVKPRVQPSQATSVGNILKLLSVVKSVDHTSVTTSDRNEKCVKIIYDVFLPDAKFRKSNPGQPAVCLCVARQEDPVPDVRDVVRLSQHCPAGSTLMFAVVDSGDVTFFAFHPVTLPTDVDVAKL